LRGGPAAESSEKQEDVRGGPAAEISEKLDATFWSGADEVDSISWALLESVLGVQRRHVVRFHGESCSEVGGFSTPGGPPSDMVAG